ncbi:hypothetical protein HZA45_00715 [Candidatus Peregrinibacteria bacterium]|nr:hypothetical protein [Candidatus Peregrinibacteria bacterium]
MTDFGSLYEKHKNLSEDAQKKAGKAIAGKMTDDHESFMKKVLKMLDKKEIDPRDPQSFLKMKVYNDLDDEWKTKVDLMLPNLADLLRIIVEFRLSKETPDESPQLETMIGHLWQMKERIEKDYDVFKF